MNDVVTCAGRILIALLFVAGALQKLVDPGPAMALLSDRGLPEMLVWAALLYNGAAGLALILGVMTRPVAGSLALYCMVTSIFHLIPDDPWQMSIFVKNWAIAGGCLVLAVQGPGRFALQPSR
ncbi:Inner membrane protein YqjF [Roseivivax sp. THAF40]|uniref:DoxX family protein n=1 Tax=unclassified Roseivivax TaxID=2639302 RepID=UPI001268A74C|nr:MULTISPECIES: DoxX family protein [unclassified Roseivivax]QFS83149.1 Inner membrane protein YqjF [Roseivivax sp. THAF197b]QFT46893.1 Inner membrane protein YqjF [Roseivivax sp. THAF40]